MTTLYRKSRYLFSTYYYKITLEKNVALVESLCVPLFSNNCALDLREYSRSISTQKNDFEQDIYNPSKKISGAEYQLKFDRAFRGNLKIKTNGVLVQTPSLVYEITNKSARSGRQ